MTPDEYRRMAALEGSHWWFQGTRRVIFDQLDRLLPSLPNRPPTILDLGCGTGGTTRLLARRGPTLGVDAVLLPLQWARQSEPGLCWLQASAAALPLPDGACDLIVALDVLEHLPDDRAALAEIARVLRPGGALLLTVPAWPVLFSDHDRALGHYRRYRAATLRPLLAAAGLDIARLSYFNSLLFPAAAAVRLGQRARQQVRRSLGRPGSSPGAVATDPTLPTTPPAAEPPPASDLRPLPEPLNALLAGLLGLERHLLARHELPAGLSLLAIARRARTAGEGRG